MNYPGFLSVLRGGAFVVAIGSTLQIGASESVLPLLNTVATAHVGEEILRQGEVVQRAAIHLAEEIRFGKDEMYALTPGYYLRGSEGIGWEYYAPAKGSDAGRVWKAPGAVTLQGSFHYSNDGKTIGLITNFYQAINAEAKGITRTTRPSLSREKIQRTLVYGGKEGSKIKLAYREVWKNIGRPSHDAYVDFELRDSLIVEIKGARIQIIDADAQMIRYRIIRPFSPSKELSDE